MSIPAVSLVLPVYNVESYLSECLDSIESQTFQNFEVILVDDGSKDLSGKICDQYAKQNSKFKVIHKDNSGLVGAWKTGVNAASAAFICFIDPDDIIEPDYLKKFIDVQREYNVDLIIGNVGTYINGKIKNIPLNVPSGYYDYESIKSKLYPTIFNDGTFQNRLIFPTRWGKMISKTLVLSNMKYSDSGMTYAEDLSLIWPILLSVKSLFVLKEDDDRYLYRIRTDSMIRGYDKNRWKSVKLVYGNLYQAFEDKKAKKSLYKQLSLDYCSSLIQVYKNEMKNLQGNFSTDYKLIISVRESKITSEIYNNEEFSSLDKMNKIILHAMLRGGKLENLFVSKILRFLFIAKKRCI